MEGRRQANGCSQCARASSPTWKLPNPTNFLIAVSSPPAAAAAAAVLPLVGLPSTAIGAIHGCSRMSCSKWPLSSRRLWPCTHTEAHARSARCCATRHLAAAVAAAAGGWQVGDGTRRDTHSPTALDGLLWNFGALTATAQAARRVDVGNTTPSATRAPCKAQAANYRELEVPGGREDCRSSEPSEPTRPAA